MRTTRKLRSLRLTLGLIASLAVLAPSSAFAQYLRYEASGHLLQFNDVIDAGTTADLATYGIVPGAAGVGTPVTTHAIVLATQPDSDADPNNGAYETIFMSIDVGNGIILADKFQRDADVYVALGAISPLVPFPLDLFGWAGSEPLSSVTPGAFEYDGQAPSGPGADDGKGHAVGGAAVNPSPAHPTDALPTTLDITDYIVVPMYLDLVDTSRETVPGTPDKIQLEFQLTSLTVTNVPHPVSVPVTGPLGIGLLSAAMAGAGLVSLRLRSRKTAQG